MLCCEKVSKQTPALAAAGRGELGRGDRSSGAQIKAQAPGEFCLSATWVTQLSQAVQPQSAALELQVRKVQRKYGRYRKDTEQYKARKPQQLKALLKVAETKRKEWRKDLKILSVQLPEQQMINEKWNHQKQTILVLDLQN